MCSALELASINNYINKAIMLNKHFHKRPLQQPEKDELKK